MRRNNIINRTTDISDSLALEAIRKFGECFKDLIDGNMNMEIREKLMYVSMLGGMAPNLTEEEIDHYTKLTLIQKGI